jgi:RimK family alpha-L-glutamate ligase
MREDPHLAQRPRVRLVSVWDLATEDPEYLSSFYPSRRIIEACAGEGIPSEHILASGLTRHLAEAAAIGDQGARTVYLVRGEASPEMASLIEKAGRFAVNASGPLRLAKDKLATYDFLTRLGVPTPETAPATDAPHIPQPPSPFPARSVHVRQYPAISFPAITKPRFGSRGRGVRLALSREEAGREEEECVVQRFVATSRGRDLRLFVAGGAVVAVAERVDPRGGLVSNASTGGIVIPCPLEETAEGRALLAEWKERAVAISREAGLVYCSVDLLYDHDGLCVCEINGAPGFEALEKGLGLDIARIIVRSALSALPITVSVPGSRPRALNAPSSDT